MDGINRELGTKYSHLNSCGFFTKNVCLAGHSPATTKLGGSYLNTTDL